MKQTKAANRYATSLLELSLDKGNLDQVAADMKYFSETVAENRDLAMMLTSPIIDGAKKAEVFKMIFGQFEPLTMSFFELITKNGRESVLPEIAAAFDAKVKEHKGIVPIELVTAIALDEATKKIILAKVDASVNGTLEVTETIDPTLIGGYIIKMGDKQIDASISNQLNNLKQRLTH
jgi:F-type H+-transporting ATPase subunit delta